MPLAPQSIAPEKSLGRVLRGVFANALGQGINAAGQIALVPIFLARWGEMRYGEWLTLSAAVNYLAMLDFGMQMYAVNRMNQCYARGDLDEFGRVVRSALAMALAVSGVAALVALPVLWVLPFRDWFHFTITGQGTTAVVGSLLCMTVLTAIPYGIVAGTYRSIGEYARGQMVNNTRMAASFVATAAVILAGGGLSAVAATQVAAMLVSWLWVQRDVQARHPEIRVGVRGADIGLAFSFVGPSLLFFLIQASMLLMVQGSVLMVGALWGAASVAIFVPLRTLANLIRQFAAIVHSALWPEMTAMEAAGRYEALRTVHLLSAKLMTLTSIGCSVFLFYAGAEVVSLWTGGKLAYDAGLMHALLILLVSQAVWMTSGLLLAASNRHRRLAIMQLAAAVGGLGLGFFLARANGMQGLVYGMWIGETLLCGSVVSWTACRMLGQPYGEFLTQVLVRGGAVAAVAFAVSGVVHRALQGAAVFRLTVFGAVVAVSCGVLAYGLLLNRRDRLELHAVIRRLRLTPAA